MYLVHSDGHTSYFRRSQRDNKSPICEFGEAILFMIPGAVKHQPKLESRFSPRIWLGKDSTTGESCIDIAGRITKARTIKRQVALRKNNLQLMDTINGTTWAAKPATYRPNFIIPAPPPESKPESAEKSIGTTGGLPMLHDRNTTDTSTTETKQKTEAPAAVSRQQQQSPSTASTAFAPAFTPARCPPGGATAPSSRCVDHTTTASHKAVKASNRDKHMQNKHQRDQRSHRNHQEQRLESTQSPFILRMTNTITTATCEDPNEAKIEQRLLKPIIKDFQGFDPEKMKKGMIKER